jgi:hypothetical protein
MSDISYCYYTATTPQEPLSHRFSKASQHSFYHGSPLLITNLRHCATKMEVRQISLDDAISLESRDSSTALRVNIFTSDAVQSCRLSCRALLTSNEASMLDYKARKAAKAKNPFTSYSNPSFTLQELRESAHQGCTACCLFEGLFRELLASLGCINPETAVLSWLSFLSFTILLKFGAVQHRAQLFCVIGL